MLGNTILKNISAAYARIERSEDQLSSGKLYRQPSDN
ncbi:MAG: flagellar hook-associated protein FlgL, partial [Candidatus Aquicultor secundus]